MPVYRFFIDQPLTVSKTITFHDTELHHMINVMRLKENDEIEIVNGQGSLAIATICCLKKRAASCSITSLHTEEKQKKGFIIAQAILKASSLELITEKTIELGVDELWIFSGMHSEKHHLSDHQLERLKSHAISAMKQCGRLYLPKIRFFNTLDDLLKECYLPIFYGDLDPLAKKLINTLHGFEKVIFFIGPEKGFDEKELKLLKDYKGTGISLHSLTLRAETASIAASALLSTII